MADAFELLVNIEQAQEYVNDRRDAFVDMMAERIDAVDAMMADRVRMNLSGGVLQSRTGRLLDTVMQEPAQISGDVITAAVTAGGDSAPYGVYFEEGGDGYYDIVPINARVLAFMAEGQMIFARMVHHPPIPKLPWFQPEVDTATEEMEAELNAVIGEVLGT
jgi:hypothetical protein